MSTVEKFLMGAIGIAMVTTLILPKRQTAPVIAAASQLITGTIGTAMGTR